MDNQAKKRQLESDSDTSEELSNKRQKLSQSNSNNSLVQIQSYKNSVQYIHEIVSIQPVKFDLINHEGPAHKPQFKFSLSIMLFKKQITFYAVGNSKKLAKTIASLKAIKYLVNVPNFFGPNEIEHFNSMILAEAKQLNIEPSVIEDFGEEIIESNQNREEIVLNFDAKTRELIATKNCLTILNHLVPKKAYEDNLVEESGMSHSKIFKFEIKVYKEHLPKFNFEKNDLKESCFFKETQNEYYFYGLGNSKKLAKFRAAQLLLETLFNIKINNQEHETANENEQQPEETVEKFEEFANNISELINNKYKELVDQMMAENPDENEFNPNKFLNVYSGIVQSNGIDFNTAKLICLTTGTKCISGECMSLTGSTIHDCHAEILGVRLLRKYMYKNLCEFINSLNSQDSNLESNIFELTDSATIPFRLKKTVNFHLYISSAPCGDSRIFSISDTVLPELKDSHPNRKTRGLLRAKLECGMGTIPVSLNTEIQAWDSIMLGQRLKVMSCSDKLCKYNVVGLQGALLSQFIETVYLDSVIVGGFYHRNHLARALYGRIAQSLNELPQGFRLNKPILSSIRNSLPRQVAKPCNKTLIWSEEFLFEIIVCKTGKKINGEESEICKYKMFKEWYKLLDLVKSTERFKELDILQKINNNSEEFTYQKAKSFNIEYQQAKLEVYKAFDQKELGKWITKPFEQNMFTLFKNN